MKRLHKFIHLLSLLLACACQPNTETLIPSLRVEATLNTYTTDTQLATPGGYKLFTTRNNQTPYIGYGGLLVLRAFTDPVVYAYDLACPYENNSAIRLTISQGIKARCNQCESEFDTIFYGNPLPSAGPAKEKRLAMRRYNASLSDNFIRIWN